MHGAWLRTPQRRDVAAWVVGAVLSGAILGTALAVLRPIAATGQDAGVVAIDAREDSGGTVAAASTSLPSSSGTPPKPTASPRRSAAPSAAPTRWGPSPAPATWVAEPWLAGGLELSELKSVTRSNSGLVEITVDRLTFYSGKDARTYYAKHPDLEPADFAVVNQNPRIYTFRLASDTPIFLGSALGSSPTPVAADDDFLLGGFARTGQRSTPSYVWLRHDGKDGGWVTYLAEQYLP